MANVRDGSFSTIRLYGKDEIGFRSVKGKLFSIRINGYQGCHIFDFGATYFDKKVSITDCNIGVCIKTYTFDSDIDSTNDENSALETAILLFTSDLGLIDNFVKFTYTTEYKRYKEAYRGMLTAKTALSDINVIYNEEGGITSRV